MYWALRSAKCRWLAHNSIYKMGVFSRSYCFSTPGWYLFDWTNPLQQGDLQINIAFYIFRQISYQILPHQGVQYELATLHQQWSPWLGKSPRFKQAVWCWWQGSDDWVWPALGHCFFHWRGLLGAGSTMAFFHLYCNAFFLQDHHSYNGGSSSLPFGCG